MESFLNSHDKTGRRFCNFILKTQGFSEKLKGVGGGREKHWCLEPGCLLATVQLFPWDSHGVLKHSKSAGYRKWANQHSFLMSNTFLEQASSRKQNLSRRVVLIIGDLRDVMRPKQFRSSWTTWSVSLTIPMPAPQPSSSLLLPSSPL